MTCLRVALIVVSMTTAVAVPSRAEAAFATTAARAGQIVAGALASPVGISATGTGLSASCGVNISWTNPQPSSVSTWRVQRYLNGSPSGASQEVQTNSYLDNTAISLLTTYSWRVSAVKGNWTSPEASVVKFVNSICL